MAAPGSAEAGAAIGPLEATVFKSSALAILIRNLEAPGKHHILDLGPPLGDNVTFFSRFCCRLYIDEIFGAVRDREPIDADGDAGDAGDPPELPVPPATRLDVVLLWDLLDYLPGALVARIVAGIRERCRAGSLVHLLVSTRTLVPPSPGRFRIFDASHVAYEPAGPALRPGPCYTPRRIERLMPGYRLLHSFLVGNGMQEYLFTAT